MESRQMASGLEAARITSLPADAFYISDFISEDEEEWLLQKVSCVVYIRLFSIDCCLTCDCLKFILFVTSSLHIRYPHEHANQTNR